MAKETFWKWWQLKNFDKQASAAVPAQEAGIYNAIYEAPAPRFGRKPGGLRRGSS